MQQAMASASKFFCFSCASSVVIVHQQQATLPITVISSSWNQHSQHYSPPLHSELPLSGDLELLVASAIENNIFGESQPHVVARVGSMLLVGCFDITTSAFETLVEVELPIKDLDESTITPWAFEGCWLLDGPTFVAQSDRIFLVVHTLCQKPMPIEAFQMSTSSEDGWWSASLLDLGCFNNNGSIRALYCGDLKAFGELELLLSIQTPLDVDCTTSSLCLRPGWNFVRFPVQYYDAEKTYSPNCGWKKIPIEARLKVCNSLFPPGLCPDLISHMTVIPLDPTTTISYLASTLSVVGSDGTLPHDFAVGFWDGNVKKVRNGKFIAGNELEDAPVALQFAIVAGGQGVLLAKLNGEQNAVLCAETLEVIRAWPKFQNVVIGDHQMLGHDQFLLFYSSMNPFIPSDQAYFVPLQLTDLKKCFLSNLPENPPPDIMESANERQKIQSLMAISKCLKLRVEAGLSQMKKLEEQRVTKAELLQSSCRLLQEMTNKHQHSLASKEPHGLAGKSSLLRNFLQASIRQQGTCGRTWYLVVDVQKVSKEIISLRELTLFLTTDEGSISGSSSLLVMPWKMGEEKQLVVAASLMQIPVGPGFPVIHVFLRATVSKMDAESAVPPGGNQFTPEGGYWMHTEWIGQVQFDRMLVTDSLEPAAVPVAFREVASSCCFIIQDMSEEDLIKLLDDLRSILKMENRKKCDNMKLINVDINFELVASKGSLWADMTVLSKGRMHLVTLRAEDSKHLLAMKALLMTRLEDKFQLRIMAACPVISRAVRDFVGAFQEELHYKKLLMSDSINDVQNEREKNLYLVGSSTLREMELQMSTDLHLSFLLTAGSSSM